MAVKIRLARRGRKKLARYDVVVADIRAPRDGRFIEKIGTYNPNTDPATIVINEERAFKWVMDGAQPTDTVKAMLSYRGIMLKKHLQIGVNKGAITQDSADKKFDEWKADKDKKITGKVESLAAKRAADNKARLEAESKVKEARAEALRLKAEEEAKAAAPAEEVETADVEASADEAAAPEAKAEETTAETPTEEAEALTAEVKEEEEAPKEASAKEEAPEAKAAEEAPDAKAKEEAPVAKTPEEAPEAKAKEDAPKNEEAEGSKEDAPESEEKK